MVVIVIWIIFGMCYILGVVNLISNALKAGRWNFYFPKHLTFTFLFQQAGEEGVPEHEKPDTPRRLLEENSRRGVGYEAR